MDDLAIDSNSASPLATLAFSKGLSLHIDGSWVSVEGVRQARSCLENHFTDHSAPSHMRATEMCALALLGKIVPDAAQAAVMVAAMEAGYPYELLEKDDQAIELKVEAEVEKGLREFLFAEMAA